MATLEAQAFEEKRENYVSSSESDDEGDGGVAAANIPPPFSDGLPQTGPKGVLIDYYRQQLEGEQLKKEKNQKRQAAVEKSAATVKTWNEEHELDPSLDPFLQQYRAQRMQEMKEQHCKNQRTRVVFGNLMEIRGDKYANVIDSAHPETLVVMHIYDDFLLSCKKMNDCLTKLAKSYQTVKFCRVQSHQLGVSHAFSHNGLPALLVYKNKELVGNLLKVTDSIGENFREEDVESFLQDHKCLPTEDEDFLSPVASQIAKKLSITSTGTESD